MRLVLERRAERSTVAAIASPLIAIALTLVTMTLLFVLLGKNPFAALSVYFIDPLTDAYSLQEIAVKATPLVMIALGLSLCYLANVWNIGAEGQFLMGAVAGSWLAVKTNGTDAGHWVLPAMLVLGALGGAIMAPKIAVTLGIGVEVIVLAFAVVAIGGMGSIEGALAGALIVGICRAATVHLFPQVELFVIYAVMALVLMIRPYGLFVRAQPRKI